MWKLLQDLFCLGWNTVVNVTCDLSRHEHGETGRTDERKIYEPTFRTPKHIITNHPFTMCFAFSKKSNGWKL